MPADPLGTYHTGHPQSPACNRLLVTCRVEPDMSGSLQALLALMVEPAIHHQTQRQACGALAAVRLAPKSSLRAAVQ